MKVLCILQNAWGDWELPIVFKPNERNKSARVLRSLLTADDVMHFANTTPVVTALASGRPPIEKEHVSLVLLRAVSYDLILVCGNQAKKAVEASIAHVGVPFLFIKHPAARDLSRAQLAEYRELVEKSRKSTRK